jgi:hypothetical protein
MIRGISLVRDMLCEKVKKMFEGLEHYTHLDQNEMQERHYIIINITLHGVCVFSCT